ncbi:diguanylate cyclase [Actimicrobium antarcticum]|uniref:Diguanylate cyclase n=1 Tax=Actimicrobium antarcticum TaxID=1051899 RepID=A0ABP7SV89_9BURK
MNHPAEDTELNPDQARSGSANALIATLDSIVKGMATRHTGFAAAIFVVDENGAYLHAGTVPNLLDDIVHAGDPLPTVDADALEESPFWQNYRALALQQYASHARVLVPIRPASSKLLGMFIIHSDRPDVPVDQYQKAIADLASLASIAIERDIIGRKAEQSMDALREDTLRMALAIDGSSTGIWDRNVVTGEMHYSAGWKAILGYAATDLSKRIEDGYSRVHPDDLGYVQATIQAHFDQTTEIYSVEHRIRCKDGRYKWISSRGKVVSRDIDGKPLRMIGTTTDISDMRAMSDRLQESVDMITRLTNEIPGMAFQYCIPIDGKAFFSYVSKGIRDIYELTPAQAIDDASLVRAVIHPDDLGSYLQSLETCTLRMTPWQLEFRVILPKQGVRWRNGSAHPRRLPDGVIQWHGFITDVTQRKQIDSELQALATTDFLTHLPNRRYFMARMDEELARIRRGIGGIDGTGSAVLMCDLDHFKSINDTYGHAAGDLVLKQFAKVLRAELRKNDTAGRVGGEEFAIVLSGIGIADARLFAERLKDKVASMEVIMNGHAIAVTVSIGMTLMTATDTITGTVLSRSDIAMYRAKELGRNRIEIARS